MEIFILPSIVIVALFAAAGIIVAVGRRMRQRTINEETAVAQPPPRNESVSVPAPGRGGPYATPGVVPDEGVRLTEALRQAVEAHAAAKHAKEAARSRVNAAKMAWDTASQDYFAAEKKVSVMEDAVRQAQEVLGDYYATQAKLGEGTK